MRGRDDETESGGLFRNEVRRARYLRRLAPGFVRTNLAESVNNPEVKAQIAASMDSMAIPADAIARAIAFAIEQPANVDVGEIVVRPTAQG